ncbi:MAG: hypothetical protein HYZ25_18625 [Chloroflexi bacterium]|nr:hypothetical protein [Chloroflexota bacterium]
MKRSFWVAFILALLFYGFSVGAMLFKQTGMQQYVYLADAFLHGHLDLMNYGGAPYDLIHFDGKLYVPGALAPALLYLPFVAVFGLGVSDVLFSVVVAAVNAALAYDLLGRLGGEESPSKRIWLTVLFAAGTVNWWISSVGSVWFNAQVTAVLFTLLFVRETLIDKRPWLAGLWLGLAALSRPTLLFAAVFFLLYHFLRRETVRTWLLKSLPFAGTFALALVVMLGYNLLRFGNLLDFGYGYVEGSKQLTELYAKYGGFNPRYMPCNIYISLAGLPNLPGDPLPTVNQMCPDLNTPRGFKHITDFFNPLGMSVFLTTPALVYVFRARLKGNPLTLSALAALTPVTLAVWMYHAPGYVQYGYRYLLDVLVFLLILLADGIRKMDKPAIALILASVFMNFIGLYIMFKDTFKISWFDMWTQTLLRLVGLQ